MSERMLVLEKGRKHLSHLHIQGQDVHLAAYTFWAFYTFVKIPYRITKLCFSLSVVKDCKGVLFLS